MDKGENNEEHNQRGNENNTDNTGTVITVSEAEMERHLQLIDILIELEIVNLFFKRMAISFILGKLFSCR